MLAYLALALAYALSVWSLARQRRHDPTGERPTTGARAIPIKRQALSPAEDTAPRQRRAS